MRRVRDPSQHPSSHFKALVEVQAELKLRRVWIEVHRAAASFERIDELESECAFLERELGLATDFHLGTKLDRISIDI